MQIDRRFFQIDDQWSVIHLPERPNGFVIFVIGDSNHYVSNGTSLWIQNYQRFKLIETLRQTGYTIIYSNLYGPNWGSDRAINLLQRLYQYIIRQEIINPKFHILTEGMGALATLKWLKQTEGYVRSIAMLSPCLDLSMYIEKEKKNPLFFKRLIKEIALAYSVKEEEVEEQVVKEFKLSFFLSKTPIKIWHATERVTFDVSEHTRRYELLRKKNGLPINLSLHLFEKRYDIAKGLANFFENHEKYL